MATKPATKSARPKRYDADGNPANCFGVTKREWAKWTPDGRETFNELYDSMGNQSLYTNTPVSTDNWNTIRWNAAWMAAKDLSHRQKERAKADKLAAMEREVDQFNGRRKAA